MTLCIGTDEAGYGPNLGPLVVAATAWRIDAAAEDADATLAAAVAEVDAMVAARSGARSPLWADSKRIYHGGAGFALLERGVAVGLALAGAAVPTTWTALGDTVGPIAPRGGCRGPWQEFAALLLPREIAAAACAAVAAEVRDVLARHKISLARVACRGIYPDEFNAQLDAGLNKSDILSAATLELAAALRRTDAAEPTVVWCDRHGGRKRYGGLVARHFDAPLVQPLEETPARSVYVVPAGDRPPTPSCRVEFCVGGESRPPVALASMTAKYVRELAMHAFNAFWTSRLPGLAPTAGYPVDALRWRRDAAPAIERAGIADDDLWRRA
jgi:hypothetical protein